MSITRFAPARQPDGVSDKDRCSAAAKTQWVCFRCRIRPTTTTRTRTPTRLRRGGGTAVSLSIRFPRETTNHPSGCGPRRRICAVNRPQGVEAAGPLRQIESFQPTGRKIIANHGLGHVAPTDAGQEQGVLGAQIGEAPGLDAYYTKIAIFGQL